jgi:tetratricopeptide (TPR) repeat protein
MRISLIYSSSNVISTDQKLLSTTKLCPVNIHAFLTALDDWYSLKSGPIIEETFFLIWFDPNIENVDRISSVYCQRINDFIRYYTDLEQCISDIKLIDKSKIVFVTAAEVAQNLLSHVYTLRCVDSVIIYSTGIEDKYFKFNDYPKVHVIFNHIILLVSTIKNIVGELAKHFQMRRSYSVCKSEKDVIYEFGDFLWFNMLIQAVQILVPGNEEKNSFSSPKELVRVAQIYYHGNSKFLEKINNFRMNYRSDDAIRWYTSDFPYKLLNKALRTENFDLLTPFLFFILDMKQCLAREHHSSTHEETKILYRGINISLDEFEKLKQMKGELISMNGFLSTSQSRCVAEMFSGSSGDVSGKVAVIFEIECDPSILDDNLIFADIVEYSNNPDEEEVLIDIGAVFRLKDIKQDLDERWVINLTGSAEISSVANKYIEGYQLNLYVMRIDCGGLHGFINLLGDRFRYENAQKHLEQLLDQPNGEEVASIYATMTRAEELNESHKILIRDHYDYTRDRLSKGDFKQSARTLNKIGFFLPRNEQIRNYPEILKILGVNENVFDELSKIKSLAFVLPQLGDNYENILAKRNTVHELEKALGNHHEMALIYLKIKDQCLDCGSYESAQRFQQRASEMVNSTMVEAGNVEDNNAETDNIEN